MQSLNMASLGLRAQQNRVNVIANNIANVNTTGYKCQRVDFQDALYTEILNPADLQQTGMKQGSGILMGSTNRDYTQGAVMGTGENLDMYIDGDGYFTVQDSNGTRMYTRSGAFAVSAEADGNYLVTANGDYVLDENNAKIKLPDGVNEISVNEDGSLWANEAQFTKLGIVTFTNQNGLSAAGGSCFTETVASGVPIDSDAKVVQGSLESSNVDLTVEMSRLIRAQKAFSMASRVVSVWDEMESTTNNLRT